MLVISRVKGSRWGRIYGEMRVEKIMAAGDISQKFTDQVDKNISEPRGYWNSTTYKLDLVTIQNFLNKNRESLFSSNIHKAFTKT